MGIGDTFSLTFWQYSIPIPDALVNSVNDNTTDPDPDPFCLKE